MHAGVPEAPGAAARVPARVAVDTRPAARARPLTRSAARPPHAPRAALQGGAGEPGSLDSLWSAAAAVSAELRRLEAQRQAAERRAGGGGGGGGSGGGGSLLTDLDGVDGEEPGRLGSGSGAPALPGRPSGVVSVWRRAGAETWAGLRCWLHGARLPKLSGAVELP